MNPAFYFAPPLIGALTGYVTNAIAVKMLFRPLEKKYVFKIPVPFTPGIIPRQRYELASQIGKAVKSELLTAEVFEARLESAEMERALSKAIDDKLLSILKTPINPDTIKIARDFCLRALNGAAEPILTHINETAYNEAARSLFAFFINAIRGLGANDEKFTEALFDALNKGIDVYFAADKRVSLNDILLRFFSGMSEESFKRAVRAVGPVITRFLRTRDVTESLAECGRRILSDVINRLTPTQRFFLAAGNYKSQIDEQMPAIIGDVLNRLDAFFNDENAARELYMRARAFNGAGDFDNGANGANGALAAAVKETIENALTSRRTDKTNGGLIETLKAASEPLSEFAAHKLYSVLADDGERQKLYTRIANSLCAYLYKRRRKTFAVLAPPEPAVREICERVSSALLGYIKNRIPELLEAIDVQKTVEDRINALPMERVESMVLDVMKKQLRWITILGGVLGFFIGSLQIVLTVLD